MRTLVVVLAVSILAMGILGIVSRITSTRPDSADGDRRPARPALSNYPAPAPPSSTTPQPPPSQPETTGPPVRADLGIVTVIAHSVFCLGKVTGHAYPADLNPGFPGDARAMVKLAELAAAYPRPQSVTVGWTIRWVPCSHSVELAQQDPLHYPLDAGDDPSELQWSGTLRTLAYRLLPGVIIVGTVGVEYRFAEVSDTHLNALAASALATSSTFSVVDESKGLGLSYSFGRVGHSWEERVWPR